MIPFSVVRNVFQDVEDNTGVLMNMGNFEIGQNRPPYPYATYLKINEVQRDRLSQHKIFESAPDNMTKITTEKQSNSVISITVISDDIEVCFDNAGIILDYIEGRFWDEYDCVLYPQSPTIEDRTIFLEKTSVECRAGFDINLYYTHRPSSEIEAITKASLQNEWLTFVSITSGSPTAEIEPGFFALIDDGQTITGDGIPDGTTITKAVSPIITLSNNATLTGEVLGTIENYTEVTP